MSRRKKEDRSTNTQAWLATFSDLVTLLLCFFVMLFGMSDVDAGKFKAVANSFGGSDSLLPGGSSLVEGSLIAGGMNQLSDLDEYFYEIGGEETSVDKNDEEKKLDNANQMAEQISDAVHNSNIGDKIDISYTSQYVELSLKGAVLFDSGSADIKSDAKVLISQLGDILKGYGNFKIAIEGHTDNVPIRSSKYDDNFYLSSARAITVARYLIDTKGFEPGNISAIGYGEFRPIASNDTEDGRAKNRRVEIKILNTNNN